MKTSRRQQSALLAIALLVALPASSATTTAPKTQVWIDVATHHMAGMPDMGALGGLAQMMGGGAGGQLHWPDTRFPTGNGKFFDVALHNSLNPGVAAEQQVPAGLGLGAALPLLPPATRPADPVERGPGGPQHTPGDGQMRMLFYWGCGNEVRAGQPREFSVKSKDGKVEVSGDPQQGRYAPDRDINPDPSYALWPNRQTRKRAPANASLAGAHRITGAGVPESLKFELQRSADFMPAIALASTGTPATGVNLSWQPVEHAKAYFLHAVGTRGQDLVIWSSAEVPDAGHGVMQYLTGGTIDRWLKEKVLLPPSTTACAIPGGIFGDDGAGMLNMIAYGPETNIAWPPRPADPKQPWNPEWNVRVRTKSTAGAMLGMDLAGMRQGDDNASPQPAQEQKPEEGTTKKLLKGLLRNL
jgi:hypothetical protein